MVHRPLPPQLIHAREFAPRMFFRSLLWWKLHRHELETAFGFPKPVPATKSLLYYRAEIEAWFARRVEAVRDGKPVTPRGIYDPPLPGPTKPLKPDWEALDKGLAKRRRRP